jgi:hypothetical protein
MISRRTLLTSSLAASLTKVVQAQSGAKGKMTLSIHQNTSRGAGYRKSLEGWAKAGIKYVELTDVMLDEFHDGHLQPRSVVRSGIDSGLRCGRAPGYLDTGSAGRCRWTPGNGGVSSSRPSACRRLSVHEPASHRWDQALPAFVKRGV